jgi:hypothetical protein
VSRDDKVGARSRAQRHGGRPFLDPVTSFRADDRASSLQLTADGSIGRDFLLAPEGSIARPGMS